MNVNTHRVTIAVNADILTKAKAKAAEYDLSFSAYAAKALARCVEEDQHRWAAKADVESLIERICGPVTPESEARVEAVIGQLQQELQQ